MFRNTRSYLGKRILRIMAVLLLVAVIAGCAGPWKGKIIDVDTKEPLEGAVVLAVWERVYRDPGGPNSYFYEAKETVTNKAGEFEIPSYTPINLLPLISFMRGPAFTIFMPGYGSLKGLWFEDYFTDKKRDEYSFELHGQRYRLASGVVELPMLKTKDERLKMLPGSSDPFTDQYPKKKKYMELINKERRELGLDPVGPLEKP